MPTVEPLPLAATISTLARKRWGDASPTVLVGRDPRFAEALDRLERFAASESTVLVTGETGTGKELFARGLYLLSRRSVRPFLRVNCAQYHEGQLMASELFGHKKGSFTGAAADHAGLFQSAHTGMLFLDEVAELSLAAQAMLLRVLSEGEIVPIGGTTAKRVDVRVVAASSSDLPVLVRDGRFRLDLYYRLRGMQLEVPSLRDRGRDWEIVGDYYLGHLGMDQSQPKRFSPEAKDVLARYEWPGNVRELKALVENGFYLSDGVVIEPRHFVQNLEQAARVEQMEKVPLQDAETHLFEELARGDRTFWEAVHAPYLDRALSRSQVRSLVARGLAAAGGSYKRMLPLFGMPPNDYSRFMDFLRHHELKPRRR